MHPAHELIRFPTPRFIDLEGSSAGERERPLVAVRMPFGAGLSTSADAENPAGADVLRQPTPKHRARDDLPRHLFGARIELLQHALECFAHMTRSRDAGP